MSTKFNTNNLSKFGRVALDLKFVNLKQLEECLQIQFRFEKAGKEVPKLGQILLAKKYITSDQLKTILEKQKDSKYNNASESSTDLLKSFSAGEVVYHPATQQEANLFLLHEGTIEILRNNTVVETIDKKGEFFGIVPFLINTPYTETARTKTDCKIFIIPGRDVNKFLYTKPEMSLKIAKILAHKIHDSQQISNIIENDELELSHDIRDDATSDITYTPSEPDEFVQDNSDETEDVKFADNGVAPPKLTPTPTVDSIANGPTEEELLQEITKDQNLTQSEEAETTAGADISSDLPITPETPSQPMSLSFSNIVNAYEEAPAIIHPQQDISDLLHTIQETPATQFHKQIIAVVKQQINIYMEIENLDKDRTAILESYETVPENIKNEINKQRREITKIPPVESLINIKNKLENKVNPPAQATEEEDENPQPPVVIEKKLRELLNISIKQKELLIQRAHAQPEVIATCATAATNEPLFKVLQKHDIDPTAVFGWGIYAMAIKEYGNVQLNKIKNVRNQLSGFDNGNNSFGKLLKMNKKTTDNAEEELLKLKEKEEKHKLIQLNTNREFNNIEKEMVNEFWSTYNKAAHLLATNNTSGTELVLLKALLRTGLLGHTSKWISYEQCKLILEECATPLAKPNYSTKSTFIYYADEVISLSSCGLLPPSPNEDLELNHRNSPEWRADRAYRKHIYLTIHKNIISEIQELQQHELLTLRKQQAETEDNYDKIRGLRSNNSNTKNEANILRQRIQKYKVRSARLEKLIEKIEFDISDRINEEIEMTIKNLRNSGVEITPEEIINHEVKTLRRNSRLVAKLKESYPPFILKDYYKPETDNTNSRSSLLELLEDIQKNDPLIFSDKLIPSAKKIHRVLVRKSPIIIITPVRGIMGFVIEPRNGAETGRFVLPGYYERATMKNEVLYDSLADFRFDNSKAEAGVDIMTSDTLVAAYATYRWNMRKKDKETRQKAGIYTEENERTNWRKHYAIYMKSALDNGRQLFYKSPDLYEMIINKFIDLPEGCIALKR